MKTLLALLFSIVLLSSCGTAPQESYSRVEMQTLVYSGQAAFGDSIEFYVESTSSNMKLPIAIIDTYAFMPGEATSGELRYYYVSK